MQWIFWLVAIIISAGAGYWVYRADKRRAVPYPWISSALRSLVVFATLLLVVAPSFIVSRHTVEKPVVVLLQDNSQSAGNALGKDSGSYRQNMEALATRLSQNYKVVHWGFGSQVQPDSPYSYRQQATDISAAVNRVQEYYGLQNLGAVVLATDGRFNQGINPLFQQTGLNAALYTVAIGDSSTQKDIKITRTYTNKIVAVNSSFEVRADIVAELCKGYNNTATIKEGQETLATVPLAVSSDKYDRSISFTIKASKAGLHHYTISVPEAEGEKNSINNTHDVFVDVVEERKNILIASASPHPDINAIRDALAGVESYKVTIVTADKFPSSLADYSVIILHGLPSQRTRIASQLASAHKPLWLITGTQTDMGALNELEHVTHTHVIPQSVHDILPAYNPAFNAFTLPQKIESVTDKMPPLLTNTGGANAAPGANVLFWQKNAAGQQVPAWVMEHGDVPTAFLLGEGIWRWRLYEYKAFGEHTVIDECIRQTVAFLSANTKERQFNVTTPKYVWSDQEPISLNGYLLNANNEQVNAPDVQLTITDSTGKKQEYAMEKSGNAYNLNIGIWAGGTYRYTATAKYNDKTYNAAGTFVVESLPLELMETGADYPMLYALARKYNGTLFPANNFAALYDSISHNDRVKPLIRTDVETMPLIDRKWYFFLVLALAVAEWLLRKYWLAQ